MIRKHRLPASARHLLPAAFLIVLAALTLAAPFWRPALWTWAALTGSYLLGNVAAAVLACRKAGWDLLPILPLVFACYHFGYGYGFLRGLWDAVFTGKKGRGAATASSRADHPQASVPQPNPSR